MSNKAFKNLKFEQALSQLEKMVQKLEEGELPLEDSIKTFESGMELTRFCEEKLNEAQSRVEMLLKGQAANRETDVGLESIDQTQDGSIE